MLDLRLTFDITPAFAKVIGDIADAIRGKGMISSSVEGDKSGAFDATPHSIVNGADLYVQAAPGTVGAGEFTQATESAPQVQTSCETVAVEAQADAPAEPAEAPKPKRGRPRKADAAQKDSQAAPESTETVEADNSTPETESAPQVQTSCETVVVPEPQAEAKPEQKAEPVAPAPAKPSGDSYGGMPLLQAVQVLLDEVAQRGIELADVNARVRQAATERGLPYTSAACLMKAIGYDETRKIVLGE